MGPVIYNSADIYIDSCQTLQDKITAIQAIIDALIVTATKAAGTANFNEYYLDDGQTKIQTRYRDVADIFQAINAFERLKQMYVNRLNGRMIRMVDGKNFTGCD